MPGINAVNDDTILAIDSLIRTGKVKESRAVLAVIGGGPVRNIPRRHLSAVAALCRRSGLPSLALRLLHSKVYPSERRQQSATEIEIAEYSGSLVQLGAFEEATRLLSPISPDSVPEAALFLAFANFSRWNYAEAIPHIKRYIESPKITEYQRLIGEVNRVAAQVIERTPRQENQRLLENLLKRTRAQGNKLLHSNVLEIAAQDLIYDGNYKEAKSLLEGADFHSEELWVEKWKAVSRLYGSGSRAAGVAAIDRVRRLASEKRQWETLRECDLFQGARTQDDRLLEKVYYWTPFSGYRRRVERISGRTFDAQVFHARIGSGGKAQTLDLAAPGLIGLKTGQLPHRLLSALLEDGYKPQTLVALHAKLFSRQYFNPASSTQQVHQILKRLRAQLKTSFGALKILEDRESYRVAASQAVELKLYPRWREPRESSFLEPLLRLQVREFSVREASKSWDVSPRSANRIIRELLSQGMVRTISGGRSTRYLIGP